MPPHADDWIGVDLDRTLAIRRSGDPISQIGEPIHAMVNRVKDWIRQHKKVKILTARVNPIHSDAEDQRRMIQAWCVATIGVVLEVTCMKDHRMTELWDDLAVRVEENTGRALSCSSEILNPLLHMVSMFRHMTDEDRMALIRQCCTECGTTRLPCHCSARYDE